MYQKSKRFWKVHSFFLGKNIYFLLDFIHSFIHSYLQRDGWEKEKRKAVTEEWSDTQTQISHAHQRNAKKKKIFKMWNPTFAGADRRDVTLLQGFTKQFTIHFLYSLCTSIVTWQMDKHTLFFFLPSVVFANHVKKVKTSSQLLHGRHGGVD